MSLLARYRGVLSADGAAAALVLSLVGRLSLGMTGLAILLLVRGETGSYAAAGAVSAAYAVSFAIGSPGRARTADRNGPVRVLRWCGLAPRSPWWCWPRWAARERHRSCSGSSRWGPG